MSPAISLIGNNLPWGWYAGIVIRMLDNIYENILPMSNTAWHMPLIYLEETGAFGHSV